ncbi:hypothetical protein DOTSEDRAFT_74997 [Dothistroma septosporum NZE10]|uniref:Uncharacterized protein n=1 Tax=Dothistroma septosporum (strain NZE10 / CBS 128990) TaxID=675120 RepID=N1PFL6_DOTSN|nr:hypothetical protein DOTSEDRAFT_74997 [Dothistroma septosporum NZE10]
MAQCTRDCVKQVWRWLVYRERVAASQCQIKSRGSWIRSQDARPAVQNVVPNKSARRMTWMSFWNRQVGAQSVAVYSDIPSRAELRSSCSISARMFCLVVAAQGGLATSRSSRRRALSSSRILFRLSDHYR